MFLRIAKILSEEQLATVRASLNSEKTPWVDGRVTAGHQGAPVKHNQQLDEASPLARELGNFIIAEDEQTLEGVVLQTLLERGHTLSTSEMFSGGHLAEATAWARTRAARLLAISATMVKKNRATTFSGSATVNV